MDENGNTIPNRSCFLKLSVPESTIAGGTVVTATSSSGAEAATPLAIGVQQVAYTESANANGVGLYFYPKAQYSASGVPFILVTAVVQSPNVGDVNTIELVDENGNTIPNQVVTSGNSGPGKPALQMGDVIEISVPLPQGADLTQNIKVQTSYQTLTNSVINNIANKLSLKSSALNSTNNTSTGTTVYSLQTQGNNINLQFTPNQIYLTANNPIQYGYLYNLGDLTASQIQVNSSSPNVLVTAANDILNGQRVIKVTYALIDTNVSSTSNTVTVTANNPAGQTETSTGGTNQNVNPLPVPTPIPDPVLPKLTVTTNADVAAGAECRNVTITAPSSVSSNIPVTVNVNPVAASSYGFGSSPTSGSFSNTASCTIQASRSSCTITDGNGLCAANGTAGTSFTATASGYSNGTLPVTIMNQISASVGCGYPLPGTDTASSCTAVSASIPTALSSNLNVTFSIPTGNTGSSSYYFSSAYGGATSSTTSCIITAGMTNCNSTLLLCAGTNTNNTSVPVTVSATGYTESAVQVSGSNPKYLFTTDATYTGDLKTAGNGTDGYDGANKLCQAAASSGSVTSPLSATWKAMLNTNNATKTCQYYKNTNNQVMGQATGGNFVGALPLPDQNARIYWNENGSQLGGTVRVWTGNGLTCDNWTNGSSGNGQTGRANEFSSNWWSVASIGCQFVGFMHLYCAQQ